MPHDAAARNAFLRDQGVKVVVSPEPLPTDLALGAAGHALGRWRRSSIAPACTPSSHFGDLTQPLPG